MMPLAVLLALPLPAAHAAFSSSANGTTAADFLNLGVGARASAMGGAAAAVADDATALYWNPGALGAVQGHSATFMHAAYLASSYYDYAAYAQSLGAAGAFGAGVQYFSLGGLNATDASGVDIGRQNPYDLAASVGYAYRFSGLRGDVGGDDSLAIGVSGKFIQQKIVTSVSGFAADFGVLSPRLLDSRLRLAAVLSNVGPAVKFDRSADPLPLTAKLGAGYRFGRALLLDLDVAAPRGGSPFAALGAECRVLDDGSWTFALRGGYSTQTVGSVDGLTGLALGIGLGYHRGSFDYAFAPMGGLGQVHRLSMNLSW